MDTKVKILVVDDDVEDKIILMNAFTELDLEDIILTAQDGIEAINFLKNLSTEDNLPHLIVLDLNMPRMNGTETLRSIKDNEVLQHIPVIIYSTSVNKLEMATCLDSGAVSYITKPINYRESLETAQYFHNFAHTFLVNAPVNS